jgi:hypothetical protein
VSLNGILIHNGNAAIVSGKCEWKSGVSGKRESEESERIKRAPKAEPEVTDRTLNNFYYTHNLPGHVSVLLNKPTKKAPLNDYKQTNKNLENQDSEYLKFRSPLHVY